MVFILRVYTGTAPAAEAPEAKKKSPSSYSGMVALTAYFFDL